MELNFEKLIVYNDAVDYANRVYAITKNFQKMRYLESQIR